MPVTVSPSLSAARRSFELAARLLFENYAAIDYDILIGDIELGDAAGDLLADQGFELGRIARAAAAGRHKGAHADVHAEAAFDHVGHGSGDCDLLGEGVLEAPTSRGAALRGSARAGSSPLRCGR